MSSPAIQQIFRDAINAAIPDALLTGSEWADTYRYVSQGPQRGEKWTMAARPFLIEPLNCITDSSVRTIVLWSASRVGKTEGLLLNANGYFMHIDPRPIMNLRPTLDDAKLFSRERWSAMVEESPVLRQIVEDTRTRDGENTMFYKKFLGGYTFFAGANAPAGLLAQEFSLLLADEIDLYPANAGGHGDPLDLADVRLLNYEKVGQALSILTSTPTIKGSSRIETAYNLGDQRRLFVPCQRCGEFQEILWSSIKWTELKREPENACFQCVFCEGLNEDDEKEEILANWEWRAHAEFKGTASFKLLGTYSPEITWGGMAVKLTEAKRAKSYEKYQVWVNSTLGELFEQGEGLDEEEVLFHREAYAAPVPAGVCYITFGADVHPDRIEVEILGWGLDDETWSIDYKTLLGNTETFPAPVWDDLFDYLTTDWKHEFGVTMRATAGAIDTGGHSTDATYKFCYRYRAQRWFAIKGANVPGRPIAPKKPSRVGTPRVKLYLLGTEAAKDKAAAMFRVTKPGPGFCHVPDTYSDEWFKQITSEKRIRSVHRGFSVWRWVKVRESARNEAWDARVYAIAAKEILNPNPEQRRERLLVDAARAKEERREQRAEARGRKPNGGGDSSGEDAGRDARGPREEDSDQWPPTGEQPNRKPNTRNPTPPSSFRVPRRRGGFVKKW
jgi:phage terminase large subunit GpA-like protein